MLRYDIINWLIEKYGYKRYLEIGVADGECFGNINCHEQDGVEPVVRHWGGNIHHMLSDDFFERISERRMHDIIFIDGDHHEGQVIKDIHNSLKHLADGGTIVVHDCNPPTEDHAAEVPTVKSSTGDHYLWNGTVWKAWVKMRMLRTDLQCRCVDTDWGCGIIQRGENFKLPRIKRHNITFAEFDHRREEYLNLITVDEFKEIYAG